jgi:hypothetical protein
MAMRNMPDNVRGAPGGGGRNLMKHDGVTAYQPKPGLGAAPAPQQPAETSYDQMIREQLERLLKYYDPQGDYSKNMQTNAINSVMRSGMGRGIQGSMLRSAGTQAATNTLQGVAGMRDQAYGQMLGLGSGRDVDLQRLSQNQRQFDADMALQRQRLMEDQRRYNQQWDHQNSFMGSGLGGALIGGGLGIVGSALGGPIGGMIGSSLGNMFTGGGGGGGGGQRAPVGVQRMNYNLTNNPYIPLRGTQSGGEPISGGGY